MINPAVTKISISKTSSEWEVIKNRLQEIDKKNISTYIQSEIWKMKSKLAECPNCIAPKNEGDPIVKRPYIRTEAYEDMKLIALKINIHPSIIIDHIVNNLLKEYPVKV